MLRALHKDGWYVTNQEGLHISLKHTPKPGKVTVAILPVAFIEREFFMQNLTYLAVFEPPEDGIYSIYFPDVL